MAAVDMFSCETIIRKFHQNAKPGQISESSRPAIDSGTEKKKKAEIIYMGVRIKRAGAIMLDIKCACIYKYRYNYSCV